MSHQTPNEERKFYDALVPYAAAKGSGPGASVLLRLIGITQGYNRVILILSALAQAFDAFREVLRMVRVIERTFFTQLTNSFRRRSGEWVKTTFKKGFSPWASAESSKPDFARSFTSATSTSMSTLS